MVTIENVGQENVDLRIIFHRKRLREVEQDVAVVEMNIEYRCIESTDN